MIVLFAFPADEFVLCGEADPFEVAVEPSVWFTTVVLEQPLMIATMTPAAKSGFVMGFPRTCMGGWEDFHPSRGSR